MSEILDFYRDRIKHPTGFTFEEILRLSDSYWEKCHELVQWLFPLPEKSKMHPTAPVATMGDFGEFGRDPVLAQRLHKAVARYERFLHEYRGWVRPEDHNHLRITRVIRCLVLADMWGESKRFFDVVNGTASNWYLFPPATVEYWSEALKPNPAWLKKET